MRVDEAAGANEGLSLAGLLRAARARLAAGGIGTPDIDARMLVSGLLGLDAKDMILHGDRPVEPSQSERLEEALLRRLAGEPVHRILGARPFFGLELALSPDTLEPRPDTEILVEAVVPFVRRRAAEAGSCSIADMGTGTGAIGLSLLSLCPEARCTGVDLSRGALRTAMENARRAGLEERFATVESDWFQSISARFDVIVANPPYVRTREIESLAREVREHDPRLALDGGEDGLDAYRIIGRDAARHLERGGLVAVEFGFDQADAVEDIFRRCGFRVASRHADLGGHVRAGLFSN